MLDINVNKYDCGVRTSSWWLLKPPNRSPGHLHKYQTQTRKPRAVILIRQCVRYAIMDKSAHAHISPPKTASRHLARHASNHLQSYVYIIYIHTITESEHLRCQ